MSMKRSDLVFLGFAMAAGFTLGYFYGSGEGLRHAANSCIFAEGFVVGGRQFDCKEQHPDSTTESEAMSL